MNVVALKTDDRIIGRHYTKVGQPTSFARTADTRMLVHDMRHFTQALIGSLDTLEIALQEHNEALTHASLSRVKESTNHIIDMVRHAEIGPQVNDQQTKQCDVADAIQCLVDSLAPLLSQNRIVVHQKLAPIIVAAIDRTDLNRLLLNLLLNAIEATAGQGNSIIVTAVVVYNEWVQITVQDNGIGVSDEELAHLFDEGCTTKAHQGNKGLGLAIIRKIIQTYHGAVRVRSHLGEGTHFRVWLPQAKNKFIVAAEMLARAEPKEDML